LKTYRQLEVIVAAVMGMVFWAFIAAIFFTPPTKKVSPNLPLLVTVKETLDISFQRQGDVVLATFVDGEACVHYKRTDTMTCEYAVPLPEGDLKP
jgi:hypothetical protein